MVGGLVSYINLTWLWNEFVCLVGLVLLFPELLWKLLWFYGIHIFSWMVTCWNVILQIVCNWDKFWFLFDRLFPSLFRIVVEILMILCNLEMFFLKIRNLDKFRSCLIGFYLFFSSLIRIVVKFLWVYVFSYSEFFDDFIEHTYLFEWWGILKWFFFFPKSAIEINSVKIAELI